MKTYKYLQLNADIGGKKSGDIIRIECVKVPLAKEGDEARFIPKERYWRDRVKDAVTDKCCEFVDKPEPKEAGTPSGKDAKPKDSKK